MAQFMLWPKPMKTPLILLSMLTLLLGPIEQARAFFCPICDGSKTSALEIIGSEKSKLRDKVGSDLGESDAGWIRKILEEPRVIDNLGFARGSTTSSGPAAGNYRFILDGTSRGCPGVFQSHSIRRQDLRQIGFLPEDVVDQGC